MEKKVYETPEVTKVEFDASDRITASGCAKASGGNGSWLDFGDSQCNF